MIGTLFFFIDFLLQMKSTNTNTWFKLFKTKIIAYKYTNVDFFFPIIVCDLIFHHENYILHLTIY